MIPAYANSEELETIMVELWRQIGLDPIMSEKIRNSKLIIQFRYEQPEGVVTIDCHDGENFIVSAGPTSTKPIVEMSMKADIAHDFWLGKVNVPLALLTGKIMARGPVNRALALLPVIKPASGLYPDIYKKMIWKRLKGAAGSAE